MSPSVAIRIQDVGKSFGHRQILHNIRLDLFQSEIFGLLGPSGSGKTTLVKIITGIETADQGNVFVFGEKMPELRLLQQIGYMAQSDALYQELTARENLLFFASLYGLRGGRRKRRISEVLELVDLHEAMNKPVHTFSGGMKRRLSLAAALLHRPSILVLDEPTVGIDPILRQSIWQELHQLSQSGTTILITTHVMDEADKCHRLAMIREGRMLAAGTPEGLMKHTKTSTIEHAFLHFGGGGQ